MSTWFQRLDINQVNMSWTSPYSSAFADSHYASNNTDPNAPPMGLRLRLKAGYDISRFTGTARVILTAFKRFGLILADNGSESLDLAKAKLLQFPKGSEFQMLVSGQDGEADAFRRLSAFAVRHGFVIK